ncbi:hypothetical protein GCM10010517_76600 [Streptosporangium fragile]|uniref:Uncharacterized protein n=1 Tax=Streptosporangium fragile TaxID=46186 RepID=A0ABN3WCQ4_9ACTN
MGSFPGVGSGSAEVVQPVEPTRRIMLANATRIAVRPIPIIVAPFPVLPVSLRTW